MAVQPTGTVTLLFTDIEGSTLLLQRLGQETYAEALDLHRRLLRDCFERHEGYEVDHEGDAFFVAFARAEAAVSAASDAQVALAGADWPSGEAFSVRMGIHTGAPLPVPPKYVGMDVHRAARIMAAGHGGQVLVSVSTRELLDDAVPLRDMGEHRLKDLSHPQRLYQLLIEGLRADFPVLKTLANRPTNLPVQPTPLVGREAELAQVSELLRRDQLRLLTLIGPGGTGKTRLALHAASDQVEEFTDGVFVVALAPIRDPELLLSTIAQTLDAREQPGESLGETLHRSLRDKKLLLVLDNFEQISAAAAEVGLLLRAASKLKILVTSRAPLQLAGEQLYPVPPLGLPDLDRPTSLDALRASDAVNLFVVRAQARRPDFELTAANAQTVSEICIRLDGLPLALELAAARANVLSPQAILQRLDQQLKLLTGGGHDLDRRQQTLRATIQWSYDLLSDDEQLLLARIGIFVGGCRLEMAEAVCDPGAELAIDMLDALTSLAEKSLIRQRADPDGEPRFWIPETVRAFTTELRDVEETVALTERLAEYLLLRNTRDMEALGRGADPLAVARYDAENPNLLVVLTFLAAEGRWEQLLRNLAAVQSYWVFRGALSEAERWFGLAGEHLSETPPELQAEVLDGAAAAAYYGGRYDEADQFLERRLQLAREQGNELAVIQILSNRGAVAAERGERAQSAAWLEEAARLAREAKDNGLLGSVIGDYAAVALDWDENEKALALAEEALIHARLAGSERLATFARLNKGAALVRLGEPSDALEELSEAARYAMPAHLYGAAIPACLAGAIAAAQTGAHEIAAQLLGVTDQLHKTSGLAVRAMDAREHAAVAEECRAALGDARFEALELEGQRGDSERVVMLFDELLRV